MLIGCVRTDRPVPIERNEDQCDHCAMIITDLKYACEITKGARTWKFDDLLCMVKYAREKKLTAPGAKFWVADLNTGDWVKGEAAHYVHSPEIRSPMGSGLAAFKSHEEASKVAASVGGKLLTFEELRQLRY